MNEEIIMSREAFEELVNGFEFIERLTKYGRINIKYHIQKLQEENKQLKEIHDKAINFIKNHIQETTYKYVYSNEVNVIQELHLDNEELVELLEILERSDNK